MRANSGMSYDPASIPRQIWETPEFQLESGEIIEDFRLSYVVHGEPAADGANVVLATSSLGGDAHRMDFMIGNGLPLDPAHHCVIAVDAIGNGWSSSPSNSGAHPRMAFAHYNIRDMVHAQHQLLTKVFGIDRFHAVVGASMGGMQALQWAVSYPNAMQAIVALVPMAKTPAWSVVTNEVSRRLIRLDPDWNDGDYTSRDFEGWRASLAFTQTLAARSPALVQELCPDGAATLGWLDDLTTDALARGFDPNDWLYQTAAYDRHDVGRTPGFDGDTNRALASIQVPALIMGPALDLLNPAEEQQRVAAHVPKARFVPIPSHRGHMAASPGDDADITLINQTTADFLAALDA